MYFARTALYFFRFSAKMKMADSIRIAINKKWSGGVFCFAQSVRKKFF